MLEYRFDSVGREKNRQVEILCVVFPWFGMWVVCTIWRVQHGVCYELVKVD